MELLDTKVLLAKALKSDEKVDALASLIAQEQAAPVSMDQIIDRMAEAIYNEEGRARRTHKWETVMANAEAGKEGAMSKIAKYRRMARKAHRTYHAVLEGK